jgi:hypothetical protein
VKTGARDALLLARLLRVGDIVPVRVPSEAEEAARDVVRAREDVRGDLMRARHRPSKLLLRHGAVWDGKQAWTTAHEAWLRRQAAIFTSRGLRTAFDADHEAVLMAVARRDRLDAAIQDGRRESVHPGGAAAGVSAWGEHADRVRPRGRDRGLAALHRCHDRRLPRSRAERVLLRRLTRAGLDHQDREHSRPPAAGRGSLAPPPQLPRPGRDHAGSLAGRSGHRCCPGPRRQPTTARTLADVQGLGIPPEKRVTAIGHSYGGVVVGSADKLGMDVDAVVHLASVGAGSAVNTTSDYPADRDVERYSMVTPSDTIDPVAGRAWGANGRDPAEMHGFHHLEPGRYSATDPDPDKAGQKIDCNPDQHSDVAG